MIVKILVYILHVGFMGQVQFCLIKGQKQEIYFLTTNAMVQQTSCLVILQEKWICHWVGKVCDTQCLLACHIASNFKFHRMSTPITVAHDIACKMSEGE